MEVLSRRLGKSKSSRSINGPEHWPDWPRQDLYSMRFNIMQILLYWCFSIFGQSFPSINSPEGKKFFVCLFPLLFVLTNAPAKANGFPVWCHGMQWQLTATWHPVREVLDLANSPQFATGSKQRVFRYFAEWLYDKQQFVRPHLSKGAY